MYAVSLEIWATDLLGKARVDEGGQTVQCGVLVLTVSNQGDGHALGNTQGQHTQKALGVDLTVVLLHPDGALIAICLLNKEGGGSGVQTAGIGNNYLATFHELDLLSVNKGITCESPEALRGGYPKQSSRILEPLT